MLVPAREIIPWAVMTVECFGSRFWVITECSLISFLKWLQYVEKRYSQLGCDPEVPGTDPIKEKKTNCRA